jgi:hypothetical protein
MRLSDAWPSLSFAFYRDNTFHSYAFVMDDTQASFYVDGTLVLQHAAFTTGGSTNTRIGRQFDPYGEYFNGQIADLRIYNNALSGTEVANVAAGTPEPASFVLLASAGLTAFAVRRRLSRPRA